MARLGINTGTNPNDGTGDTLFSAGDKTNKNFIEIYTAIGDGSTLNSGFVTSITAGDNIIVSGTDDVTITGIAATSDINADSLVVSGVSTLGVVTGATYYGDGSNLTGITTLIKAGSNITVTTTAGITTIASTGGGGGGSFSIGFGATTGETPYIVGTGVTQINFVGAGYTIEASGGVATVRNLKMDLKQINFTSAGYATTINEGTQVSYTATVDDSNAVFAIEDNGGLTGIGINYSTGAMGGGQQASPGTYTVKLRASTPFGMSDSFPVSFTINAFTLSMNTMFGDAESLLVGDDDVTNAQYIALGSGGVVANDGVNYVIDRDNDVLSNATEHALYYDNTNNALIGFRYDSGGSLNGIGRWTSVTTAVDGTDVGSGSMWTTDSGRLSAIGSTQSCLRGVNLGISTLAGIGTTTGGFQPVSQYNGAYLHSPFYMRIVPSDSALDNFGTDITGSDYWSYGFTLEDPWLLGSPMQMLAPESTTNGWTRFGLTRYYIGTSAFNRSCYGNASGLYDTTSGFDATNIARYQDQNNIAPAGSTVQVFYLGGSLNDVLVYINGELVLTNTSAYVYMKNSGSTSQPALSFGDISNQTSEKIPDGEDELVTWSPRIRDLWICNSDGLGTDQVAGISTFNNRNLEEYVGYSSITTYITLTDSAITAVKGNVSIARSAVDFT